jgi:hypothetical protein
MEPRYLGGCSVIADWKLEIEKICTPERRFMESLLSIFRMHWDHEPSWRRSADSHVREVSQLGSRGQGCPRPGEGSWRASTIPKSCIGTMNLDVEQAFQSRRGGIRRPFQPGVLSGDSKVARTRRQECLRYGETVRGQDVRVSKTRGMRMVELPQKIRPVLQDRPDR